MASYAEFARALGLAHITFYFGGTDREAVQCRQYQLAPRSADVRAARSYRQAGTVSITLKPALGSEMSLVP